MIGRRLINSLIIAAVLLVIPVSAAAQSRARRTTPMLVHGAASISHDSSSLSWTLGNDSVTLTVGLGDDGTLRMIELSSPTTNPVALDSRPDTFVTVRGEVMPLGLKSGFAFFGHDVVERPDGVELALTFQLRHSGLFATRHYAVYSTAPIVEVWTTLTSSAEEAGTLVSNLNGYDLAVPAGSLSWINGLQAPEADGGAFTLRRRGLASGEEVRLGSEGRASESTVPWWEVDSNDAQLFGGLMWSGAWSATFVGADDAVQVTLGLAQTATEMSDGAPLEMPHAFLGITGGGPWAVSSAMRSFVEEGIRHGRPFEAPVVYNTWFVYGTRIDDEQIRMEMSHAAELGVEIFVVDAGWYVGSGDSDVYDFETGLGSWSVDRKRFPDGLASLTDYAHSLGMRFGLWVEPGRSSFEWINQPGLARDEWLVMSDGRYDPGMGNEAVKVGQLCLADEDARLWIVGRLEALIDSVRPDYLKWDNNDWTNCDRPGHDHGATDGNFRQVHGLYAILDELRSRYPDMLVENVSGGGNRLDFQMLGYSDVGWMDDRSTPSLFVRHNLEGLATVFPPAYLFSFVMGNSSEPLVRANDLASLARSRMPGVMGLTVRTGELSESEFSLLTGEIAIYKRLRPILRKASAALLLPQVPRTDPMDWDALQVTSAETGDAVIFAFANPLGPERTVVRLRGLQPLARYLVESIDVGGLGVASGAELMINGVELNDSPISNAHILLVTRQ